MKGELQRKENRIITTKATKENYGIGLQNVYDIVKQYNGEYHITTQNDEYVMQMVFSV